MGRRRSCSRPPTIAAAMSIILRAQKPESGPMVACLVVLLKMASALCSAAVSGGTSWAPSGRSTTSISGSASMILVQSATSCLQALVQLAGVRVDDLDALAEVGEADPAVLEHDVPGRVAAAQDDGGGRRADRVLDEVRRQAHHVRLAVDLGAGRGEDLPGLVVLDEDARARQHLERRAVDLPQLVVGEHLEPEAAALARSRARVPDHGQPPAVRSLNFSTLLIGTSSTRAMLNFASIWLACHGWLIA